MQVIGSRFRIHAAGSNMGIQPDLSVQHLVNCATEGDPVSGAGYLNHSHGCDGGSSYGAFAFAHNRGVVDSSCLPYSATNHDCTAEHSCQQHLSSAGKVNAIAQGRVYYAREYGFIQNESAMLKEIYARGPIACCMACPDEFEAYTHGVYVTHQPREVCDHLVTMVGFGHEANRAYWLVQNSFGSVWGEQGFFRIARSSALAEGEHNLGIEKMCSWMMPDLNRTNI